MVAKVLATNNFGSSDYSLNGSGANLTTLPDAPSKFVNEPSITNANQIGLSWVKPSFNGGSEIIDYTLWNDNGSNGTNFLKVASNVT